MKIDMFTFIANGCSDYAELLHRSCEAFRSSNHTIKYKAIETNGGSNEWPDVWEKVATTGDYEHGSLNHAIAIHKAIELSESDITIIADCDMCILFKNWDCFIIDKLKKFGVVGVGYSDYRTAKYYNFPTPHFMCFRKLPVKLDFSPEIKGENVERINIKTKAQEKTYCKNIGEQVKCDTGFKNVSICKNAGINSFTMKQVYNFQNSKLFFRDVNQKKIVLKYPMQHSEWHCNGGLFATHKQKCTVKGHEIDSINGKIWIDRINMFTKKWHGFML